MEQAKKGILQWSNIVMWMDDHFSLCDEGRNVSGFGNPDRQPHGNQYPRRRRVSQDALFLLRLVVRRRCTRVSDSQMTWLQAARRTTTKEQGRKEGRRSERTN